MSALGQKRTKRQLAAMSALPPKADIDRRYDIVRFVPQADFERVIRLSPKLGSQFIVTRGTKRIGNMSAHFNLTVRLGRTH